MTGIREVADHLGVSTATVSRALRGLPGVSPSTRERVAEAASRLGYAPSPHASSLAGGSTRTVAVVVPFVTRWFFGAVVHGAEEVLRAAGYDLLLHNLAGDEEIRHRVFEGHLLAKRVDATLVLALTPTEEELAGLRRAGRPTVFLGTHVPGWPSVRIDDVAAARLATEHLLALGHRRIGYVGGSPDDEMRFDAPYWRVRGHQEALRDAGIGPDPCLLDVGGFTAAGGREAGLRLLSRPADARPTAIFAASDEMAFGVLQAARELRVRVPQDVSVIGIDDHDLASYFDLTTVAQPVEEQGRLAARLLLHALGRLGPDEAPTGEGVVLPVRLVERGTTAPPRGVQTRV